MQKVIYIPIVLGILMISCQSPLNVEEILIPYNGGNDAQSIQDFIQEELYYTADSVRFFEEWYTPQETWDRGTGDCEDINMLYAYMLTEYGDYDNVEVIYGKVQYRDEFYVLQYAYHVWLKIDDRVYDATTKKDNAYYLKVVYYDAKWVYTYDEALMKTNRRRAVREVFNYG